MTIYLGLQNPRPIRLVSSGDYSYGLYLYGYPLQQAVASLGPAMHHWWINVGLALPSALLVAFLSWHWIEQPTLGLRRRLQQIEDRLTRLVCVTDGTRTFGGIHFRLPLQQLLALGAVLGGIFGTLLLINGNEGLAVAAMLSAFIAAVLLARHGAPALRSTRPI